MAPIQSTIEYVDIEMDDDGMIHFRTSERVDKRPLWQDETRALYLFLKRPDVEERLREKVFSRDDSEDD